jgi:hypothetical protein
VRRRLVDAVNPKLRPLERANPLLCNGVRGFGGGCLATSGWLFSASSTDLELVYDGSNQKVGIRFPNLAVPAGAMITRAYVQFEADETQSEATTVSIQGQAADNALTFSSATKMSTRSRTTAATTWTPAPWTLVSDAGVNQRTPDLSAVVPEIVGRPGWANGNALALIITGTGHRTTRAYDGKPAAAPRLHLEYTTG